MSATSPILEARGLSVRRGGAELLSLDHLAVSAGETLALIGPNGAGKSTLLLALSGIEPLHAGELRFRGERVPAGAAALGYRRRVAMAFQEPLLLDTTVFENVAAGLRLRGTAAAEIGRRVGVSMERFRIGHLSARSARTLSGGEAQRASLARALAVAPEVLLLDEPFAALDPPTREALIEDLARTLHETGTTTVFATHDHAEARRVADRIAVLDSGRLRQVGTAAGVFRRPADAFVAEFVGVGNLLPVMLTHVSAVGEGLVVVDGRGVALTVAGVDPSVGAGEAALLCVRPENVLLRSPGERRGPAVNRVAGTVVAAVPKGPFLEVTVDCGFRIVAVAPDRDCREASVTRGAEVEVSLRPDDLYVIAR